MQSCRGALQVWLAIFINENWHWRNVIEVDQVAGWKTWYFACKLLTVMNDMKENENNIVYSNAVRKRLKDFNSSKEKPGYL